MQHPTNLHIAAAMNRCLAAILEVGRADDLDPTEIALRLTQFADVAHGAACPEVAFDPTAVRLRAIDNALRERPSARDAWRARVRRAIAAASSGVVVIAVAA